MLLGVCGASAGVVGALFRAAGILLGVLGFLIGEELLGLHSSSDSAGCRRRLLGVMGCAVGV